MSIVLPPHPATPQAEPKKVVPDETLHFDYPGSDIILRSCDSHDFRVPQLYIANCSPVLREAMRSVSNTSDVPNGEEQKPLPVVKLQESGAILHGLLTFIFPVAPILPSTTERIMELLAVAQKYQMDSILTHIRGAISRQDPPFIRPETALHVYFLAQKYELHQEVLQAARSTLRLSLAIEDLEDKIDFMPGAYLRELWKYHERVRKDLSLSLLEFRKLGVPDDLSCGTPVGAPETPPATQEISPSDEWAMPSTPALPADPDPGFHGIPAPNFPPVPDPGPSSGIPAPAMPAGPGLPSSTNPIPQWLGNYIKSLEKAPHLFDLIEFENARARHIQNGPFRCTTCSCITSQAIRAFWEALTAVVHGTIEKADSTLALVTEETTSENSDLPFTPLCLDVPEANIIVRSSDQTSFRVHKSLLAMTSPFFRDLLSLPQPPDGELVDGLPVIQLSEDAGLLNSLISLLYPVTPNIPSSYERVFALLAACQKYEMASIQSIIRAEIKRREFPAPVGAEAFRTYAVASSMGLIPEMESAARLTLGYPMTFESLGEDLRSFKGRALCDLVRYRKRCRDNLVSCIDSFFHVHSRRQIWAGCRPVEPRSSLEPKPSLEPKSSSEPKCSPKSNAASRIPSSTPSKKSSSKPSSISWGFSVNGRDAPTSWQRNFFSRKRVELENCFTHAIDSPSTIIEEYLAALKNHDTSGCGSCFRAHAMEGGAFCRELEDELTQALDKVSVSRNKPFIRTHGGAKSRRK